jgi:hypothetical protein
MRCEKLTATSSEGLYQKQKQDVKTYGDVDHVDMASLRDPNCQCRLWKTGMTLDYRVAAVGDHSRRPIAAVIAVAASARLSTRRTLRSRPCLRWPVAGARWCVAGAIEGVGPDVVAELIRQLHSASLLVLADEAALTRAGVCRGR